MKTPFDLVEQWQDDGLKSGHLPVLKPAALDALTVLIRDRDNEVNRVVVCHEIGDNDEVAMRAALLALSGWFKADLKYGAFSSSDHLLAGDANELAVAITNARKFL